MIPLPSGYIFQRFLESISFTCIITLQVKLGMIIPILQVTTIRWGAVWMGRLYRIVKLIDGSAGLLDGA